jgi:hypothetical protein
MPLFTATSDTQWHQMCLACCLLRRVSELRCAIGLISDSRGALRFLKKCSDVSMLGRRWKFQTISISC